MSGYFLKDISPLNAKSILVNKVKFSISTGREKIIYDEFKIKDYDKFLSFLKDSRINSLLEYYNEDEVSRFELEKELKLYQR